MKIRKKWRRIVLFWVICVFLLPNSKASSKEQIRAGTIEFHTRAAFTDEGIATYGFNLTDIVMQESLKINMVFKLDRGNERVRVYEIERAEVDFESKMSGKTGVQTEAAVVKMVVPEQGQLKRPLSPKECDLTLYIDLKKQTYNITGKVFVPDIPFTSKGKAVGKIAGLPPQSEDLSDEWTEDREEEIDIRGELDPEKKDVLSGSESSFDLPETMWMQSFWKGLMGGNIEGATSWDIRIPILVIEQDGEDITYDYQKDNIQEEVVGKKINLKGNVKPAHLKMADPEWIISDGKYLKEFRANEDKGEKVELEDADKKNQEVHFHWYDKGEKLKVTYSAEVEGETLYAEAFFNVKKPSIIIRAEIPEGEFAFGRVVYGDERGNQVTEDELIYYPVNRDYTIKFTHNPLPSEFPGETQYIQLVHTIGHVEKHKA
ncbi:MAG: hypothetical protein GF421_08020, partial [Candidatus Aminicenantes bacterium]|nr:hypothetical protein [Candidatus Aminicenantes bacterium]